MSRFNHRTKWTRRDYIIRYLSVSIVIAILVICMPRENVRTYHYSEGGIWDYPTLIAEDSFPILKSEEQLQREKDSVINFYEPYFLSLSNSADSAIHAWHQAFQSEFSQTISSEYETYVTTKLMELYDHGIISGEEFNIISDPRISAIRVITGNVSSIRSTAEIYSPKTAYEALITSADTSRIERSILTQFKLNRFLTANLKYDAVKSDQQRLEAESYITPYLGQVIVGQKIVDRGEIIDSDTYRILESMHLHISESEQSASEKVLNIVGQLIFTCVIVILLLLYFQQFRSDYLGSTRAMLLICTLFLLFPLITYAIVVHTGLSPYIVPFCITPVFVRIFMDSRTAFITHLMTILMCALCVAQPAEFIIIQSLAGLTAIISLRQLSQRSELFRAILFVLAVSALTYISIQLINRRVLRIEDVNYSDLTSITIGSLLLMISYLLLIPIERIFGFTSSVTLVELSNANTPLLRRMSEEAPGTFQHSMQVANLAAAVAEKLGAKSQLVRTGALYHDIGKIRHAAFYTENQRGINPHDRLTNLQSANIIISHVREGLTLAEKHKLPQVICDFIATHHGNSMARYFYIQACNNSPEIEIDPVLFTYPGPNPQTAEQAILMMCDAVEAASRSLKEITEESISNLVDKIIDNQMSEGYFKQAPITFQDIESAKDVLKNKLRTIYHTRIQYPELKK
ncbi:MAG: HDIG domain-containing protein [Bacteroidaceae bacterium]|nr:HDIG domain-containing protein [Bacteroidaceae bacterium]